MKTIEEIFDEAYQQTLKTIPKDDYPFSQVDGDGNDEMINTMGTIGDWLAFDWNVTVQK